MFAKFNDTIYSYVANRGKKEIITRNGNKTNADFKRDGEVFCKTVSEEELADIFNVEIWVKYNTGYPNTPFYWQVEIDGRGYADGKILLRFSEGILPGWDIEEKNVCIKYVDVKEIEKAKVVYVYKRKEYTTYLPPKKVEKEIIVDEMLCLLEKYKKANI